MTGVAGSINPGEVFFIASHKLIGMNLRSASARMAQFSQSDGQEGGRVHGRTCQAWRCWLCRPGYSLRPFLEAPTRTAPTQAPQ